jgi:pimeloyl-ACP methyl ester carboxylesterase
MNAVLSAGMISGFRSNTVGIEGVRLHYWVGGDPDGQPDILWHGFLFVGAGLSVMVPDMRGCGDSDKPDGNDGYDARALAEECRSLVAKIGVGGGRPIILAAHDMGALPALISVAENGHEVAGLLYIEAPVMLGAILPKVFDYTPEAMAHGSMCWWILQLALGVPERLIVGNERAFLGWFYEGDHVVQHEVFSPSVVNAYWRSFSGRKGVFGALGIYRAAFTSIEQTEPLKVRKVTVPVVALGGEKGLGAKVSEMVKIVAATVESHTLKDCGHFMPEEELMLWSNTSWRWQPKDIPDTHH